MFLSLKATNDEERDVDTRGSTVGETHDVALDQLDQFPVRGIQNERLISWDRFRVVLNPGSPNVLSVH